jgi:RNA polymerase sigma-70 factor (ECF subfamily)
VLESQFDDVLAAAQEGAEWAWKIVFDEYSGPVLGYLRSQGTSEPEDLLSEVFLQVARNVGTFNGSMGSFRSWVFTVAHSRIIDDRRRRRRHPVDPVESLPSGLMAEPDVTQEAALESMMTARVEALLHSLVPDQRDVLMLRIVARLTVAETAEAVGKSQGAVKALQRRGLSALRRRFDAEGISL